jgi:long-chain acyl-CoA synthetase
MTANLAAHLTSTAAGHGSQPALRLGEAITTYAELDQASALVAGLLQSRGVRPGDRVGIMLPNVPEFAVVYYGTLRAGAVVVPMNPLLKSREVGYYLGDSGAKLMFCWHGAAAEAHQGAAAAEVIEVDPASFGGLLASATAVDEVADRTGEDTAVILYTSGTTGQPKGAELTHANLSKNTEVMKTDLVQLSPADIIFGGLPLFHSFGQTCTLNAAIASGASLALLPRFDPRQALQLIAGQRATVFAGVPTMFSALLGAPDIADHDVSALRVCVSGGAAMPVEVLREFERVFGCKILEGYGLSETSPVASFNHPDAERKPGSIGTPIRGVQMRLVDDQGSDVSAGEHGEIAIRGHNVMKGYWQRPAETAAAIPDGWFRTGDIAKVDDDGYFFIVDRKKDLIIRGGYNVYPREIEEVLYEHPQVAQAAVIGVPHPQLGEEVAAAVTLKPGSTVTAAELRDFVKGQVAAYKYPRDVWLFDALPLGPTGKILKREIKPPASGDAAAPAGGAAAGGGQ